MQIDHLNQITGLLFQEWLNGTYKTTPFGFAQGPFDQIH